MIPNTTKMKESQACWLTPGISGTCKAEAEALVSQVWEFEANLDDIVKSYFFKMKQ